MKKFFLSQSPSTVSDQMKAEIERRCGTLDSSTTEPTDFLCPVKKEESPEREQKSHKNKSKKQRYQ